ncbi:MerR family transcriptional regulator [Trichocoleus desertorum AS-A10]|uniref:MerR family transcriptional regulator n=1 Tax=Trichocoleus desertorum TaxID=1481672 RepID=UPI003297C490
METGFTRQEALRLTGLTSNQISYLDRIGLVKPKKIGHPKHPTVIYTWEQLLEIKAITRLREKVSPEEMRQAIDYLRSEGYQSSLFQMGLLSFNSKLYWVKDEGELKKKVIELTTRNQGQIVMHTVDPIGDVISEVYEEAKKNYVLDFDKRAKGTPLETHG